MQGLGEPDSVKVVPYILSNNREVSGIPSNEVKSEKGNYEGDGSDLEVVDGVPSQCNDECGVNTPVCDSEVCRACESHNECGEKFCDNNGACVEPKPLIPVIGCINQLDVNLFEAHLTYENQNNFDISIDFGGGDNDFVNFDYSGSIEIFKSNFNEPYQCFEAQVDIVEVRYTYDSENPTKWILRGPDGILREVVLNDNADNNCIFGCGPPPPMP